MGYNILMQITSLADLTTLTSAEEIFEHLRAKRSLELDPPPPSLPALIKAFGLVKSDLNKAQALINKHLKVGSDILIYGDYDADGITATAIMWTTLTRLTKGTKARTLPFIPDRTRHGYGLSDRSLADIFSGMVFTSSAYPDFSPRLVITVDNGIVANQEVKTLRDKGVDVIITDHHLPAQAGQPGKSLPPADVILHSLVSSGAGLAFVLALFLTDSRDSTYDLLDLATVGIVADQLPLTGINRTLVTHGLRRLNHTHNPGLLALVKSAGLSTTPLSTYHLNFVLAPRLNAAGRLADATDALRLLCTKDSKVAAKLARSLAACNEERQLLTEEGITKALLLKPRHRLIITASQDYHEGVIGLIAGRLAEHFFRPAIAISLKEGISKGSARSLGKINIIKILRQFPDLFEGLGGHELAAGFSVKSEHVKELTRLLEQYADTHLDPALLVPALSVDGLVTLSQTSLILTKLLEKLAPFGLGNPKPRFLSRNLAVIEDRRMGEAGQHRRLTVEQNGVTRQAVWFKTQVKYPLQLIKELAYTLDVNVWREKESLQLVVKHASL